MKLHKLLEPYLHIPLQTRTVQPASWASHCQYPGTHGQNYGSERCCETLTLKSCMESTRETYQYLACPPTLGHEVGIDDTRELHHNKLLLNAPQDIHRLIFNNSNNHFYSPRNHKTKCPLNILYVGYDSKIWWSLVEPLIKTKSWQKQQCWRSTNNTFFDLSLKSDKDPGSQAR